MGVRLVLSPTHILARKVGDAHASSELFCEYDSAKESLAFAEIWRRMTGKINHKQYIVAIH